jgi:hypothetical protein
MIERRREKLHADAIPKANYEQVSLWDDSRVTGRARRIGPDASVK